MLNNDKRIVIHFAPAGEWGGSHVSCGRYFTTDVRWTGDLEKVTCKYCLKPKKYKDENGSK